MVRRFCDHCETECKDQDFSCEVTIREIKRAIIQQAGTMDARPQLSEKFKHFCRRCVEELKI